MSAGGYRDYWKVLGLERGADGDAVKKAFRKLARQHHPDVNPGDKAAEARFKEISEAYEVLSDPEKREIYDEFGEQGIKEGHGNHSAGFTSPMDMFNMFFGGGGGAGMSNGRPGR